MTGSTPPPRLRCNMGFLDRSVRAVAVVAFALTVGLTDHLSGEPALVFAGGAFSALNLFAILTGFCPMYVFTDTDTRRKNAPS
jgi:hypothetical protein